MPAFLEHKLMAQAAAKGMNPKQAARYTYGTLNNLGAMHGNRITLKGQNMEAKHLADQEASGEDEADEDDPKSEVPHPHKNLGAFLHKAKKGVV